MQDDMANLRAEMDKLKDNLNKTKLVFGFFLVAIALAQVICIMYR